MKKFTVSPLVLAMAAAVLPVTSYAQESATPAAETDSAVEEVMVTGIRASMANALNAKRGAANNIDAIVAEDMGKMPDLNLAESLQRVSGVAITREGGEGRNITVRGLGPSFSATTLNGMEVPSSTGGLDSSGGVNRGRAFDFNVFASELFNKILINKSAKGSLEEGGLASTVELYSAKPFDNPGFHAIASGNMAIENLTDENDPRVFALVSNTFNDDKFGVLLSFAQSERNIRQEGFGTVRWISPLDNSNQSFVGNDSTVNIEGTPNPLANYPDTTASATKLANEKLDFMLYPRLPRMDSFNTDQERTGITGSFQFRPSDRMEFTLDYLKSSLETDVTSYNFFAQFRNSFNSITPTHIVLDDAGRVAVAGEFTGVTPRVESRGQFSTTDFEQVVLSSKFELTDSLKLDVMFGNSSVVYDEEQYRFNLDALAATYTNPAAPRRQSINGLSPTYFSYDFRNNGDIAEMAYGFDITNPLNYHFTTPTIRKDVVERENDTFRSDLTWEINDESSLKTGLVWNERNINSERHDPSAGTLTDPVARVATGSGTATILPITAASTGLTTTLSAVTKGYGSAINPPAGFPTNFVINDFAATKAAYNAGSFTLNPNDPTTFDVTENTTGIYTEYNRNMEVAGMPLMINAGLRYVETEVESVGVAGNVASTRKSDYAEWLPSANATLEVVDDFVIRFSANRNLSRPGLSSMTATVNATPINANITVGNPGLDPIIADAFDLGFEWYFADEAVLGLTLFHKNIDSFIINNVVPGTLSPELKAIIATAYPQTDPNSAAYDPNAGANINSEWNISTPLNGEGAKLNGYEISYQQPFTFLPVEGFGAFANFTYVDSELTYANGVKGPLVGLSENSYNYGFYFERESYGARVVVNGRDDYVTAIPGSDRNYSENTTGPTRIDLSGFYNITENIKVSLEVINLTEEDERLFTTGPEAAGGDLNLVREINNTGREITLGIRASF
ncbi:MAG: TonB-dependent receptor [Cellvibrio sp.]|uniref:TonB-dependent receptor n=1 Tax=Cellvibrio sp. TaxID=1965322 RepID=UPI00319EC41B